VGTDFFWKAQKAKPARILAVLGGFSAILAAFNRLTCVFLSNLDWKLYKFDKKVIAIEKLDDYHNMFGYKN
jgi:hypothetical protein